MSAITIYEKPTCSTCRKATKLLEESGVDFETVNYYVEAISENKLRDLLRKMNIGPRELLRAKEPACEELGIKPTTSDEELISLMSRHPDLIQRPIVERGEKAVLGRPVENIKALL